MNENPRRPQAFRVEPPEEAPAPQAREPRAMPAPEIRVEDDFLEGETVDIPAAPPLARRRGMHWGSLLASAVGGLVVMWAGLAFSRLIEDLFARSDLLGWIAAALAALAALAAIAIILREILGLMRLARLGNVQADAARAFSQGDAAAAQHAVRALLRIYRGRADLALGVAELERHAPEIIDAADRMRLAERDLMVPLDDEAGRMVARAARRVTLLTAVSPTAALDILFVAAQNLRMLREIATLYGGRPGTLGTFRLARMVVGHLAVTGGLALSDNLVQAVVGRGLMGRLSARLGEGTVNGILTTRIGLAAIDVCRPLPFVTQDRPGLADFLREVVRVMPSAPAEPART